MFQLSFNESDKVRAINCPPEVEDLLDKTINAMWEVQRKRPYGASTEWKLRGCPWDWGHWQNKGDKAFEMLLHGATLAYKRLVSTKYLFFCLFSQPWPCIFSTLSARWVSPFWRPRIRRRSTSISKTVRIILSMSIHGFSYEMMLWKSWRYTRPPPTLWRPL